MREIKPPTKLSNAKENKENILKMAKAEYVLVCKREKFLSRLEKLLEYEPIEENEEYLTAVKALHAQTSKISRDLGDALARSGILAATQA